MGRKHAKSELCLRFLPLLASLSVAGCGGDSVHHGHRHRRHRLPIVGTVTIKDGLSSQRSAQIQVDGRYRRWQRHDRALRAAGQRHVGGRTVDLYSSAIQADVGSTINSTPFTDLILANLAGELAENFYNRFDATSAAQANATSPWPQPARGFALQSHPSHRAASSAW